MKPLVQKLPFSQNTSFLATTIKTPEFEVPWHQHIEYEFALFIEGEGMNFIGNYVGEFNVGDVFFLGKNLPHAFQKTEGLFTSVIVIQFLEDFWGKEFINIPESKDIKQALEISTNGLQFYGKSKQILTKLIKELECAKGIDRIITLCKCLKVVAEKKEFVKLSTLDNNNLNLKDKERIDKIFKKTIDTFQENISVPDIAWSIGMTHSSFCKYFKKSTKKTYISFLNEIRIGYACNLLIDTRLSILEICFQSGYNTLAHFNRQFLKQKKYTPSHYRKLFTEQNY